VRLTPQPQEGGPSEVLITREDGTPVLAVADVDGLDAREFAQQLCALWNLTNDPYRITCTIRHGIPDVFHPPDAPGLPAGIVSLNFIDYDGATPDAVVVFGGEG
jgi:hypothetical protein